MTIAVYCDNAFPDLFTSGKPKAKYLMIGSLWLPVGLRNEVKDKIKILRERHETWGEIKWGKVSRSRLEFYIGLIDLFMNYSKDDIQFRCIAVDRERINHDSDYGGAELGIYKFYQEVLNLWTNSRNNYRVYCETDNKCFQRFKRVLLKANVKADIQALPSKEVMLIQFTDLLLGAASSRTNETLREGTAKEDVVKALEQRLGESLEPTVGGESKFNLVISNSQ